jgi:phosphoglycolate phosphatase
MNSVCPFLWSNVKKCRICGTCKIERKSGLSYSVPGMRTTRRKVELVIFDLDGTLVDSRDDIAAALNVALAEIGCAPRRIEEITPRIGEPLDAIFRRWIPGDPPHLVDDAVAAFRRFYFDNCARRSALYPGVRDCLERLAPIPLAVATTKSTRQAVRVCEQLDLARHFAVVQGSDDIPHKPDPAVVRAVLARLRISPDAAWMVGDTPMDVQAGRAAGCATCAVTYGIGERAALSAAGPDLLIDAAALLPGALLGRS